MAGDEKPGFGWLHLTDQHVGIGPDKHLWENHESDLHKDLRQLHSHAGPWDLLFFTGDLTQRGSKAELEVFDQRLSRVMETVRELQDSEPVFLPVPGNHDLKRPGKESGAVALAKTFTTDTSLRESFWTDQSAELRKDVKKAFLNWTKWWESRSRSLRGYTQGLLPGEYSVSLELGGLKIGVLGLNSAALHLYDTQQGALSLDSRQVQKACGESSKPWTEKHDLCFLLTHHPPDWLDAEGRRALDEDICPPDTFALHLFGHVHEAAFQTWTVGAGYERGRLLGRSLFGLEWLNKQHHHERMIGYVAGRCWLDERRRHYQLWPRSARRVAGGGGWRIAADTDHFMLPDDRATRVINLGESPCRAATYSPPPIAEASPLTPVVVAVARTETHVFNPLSNSPFSERCQGVRAAWSAAALFADRLLIALKTRPEHADLPYRIEDLLLGKLGPDAALQLHRTWLEGVKEFAPGATLPADDALDALHRLLSPVAACVPELRLGLRGVITRALPKDVLDGGRLALMGDERQRHLPRFKGRGNEVTSIHEYLMKRRVVIICAPEGLGKSAIVSRLIESLKSAELGAGHDLITVRRECDWLPGPLVVFGKKAERQPEAIVRLLLAQANTMLVQPVVLPTAENDNAELPWNGEVSLEPNVDSAWENGVRGRKGPGQSPSRPRRDRDLTLRAALNKALARLVEERGSADLVLDALDEISPDGSDLGFIPDDLPAGSSMLLATQNKEGILRRFIALRPVQVNLEGVDQATASAMTGLPPGPELSRIWNDAQGSPLILEWVRTAVRDRGGSQSIDVMQTGRPIFQSWVAQWRLPGQERSKDLRYQMLILFAMMEGVGPLSLDAIQGFCAFLGMSRTRAEVTDLLEPVASHLDGLANKQPKLTTRKLADFVWREELGLPDRRGWMKRIVDWLGADELVEVSFLMNFLKTWTDTAHEADAGVRGTAGSLVDSFEKAGMADKLYNIFDLWPKNDDQILPPVLVACLRAAAVLGNLPAMRRLGSRMMEGTGLPAAPVDGERWLRSAAEAGEMLAMANLGSRLLDGRGMSKDVQDGESWLRKAAEAGDPWAMMLLGIRLLDGEGVPQNAEEGEGWLLKAAEAGEMLAMANLGSRLLDGRGITQDVQAGGTWLRKAAQAGDPRAMMLLGIRLLEGDCVPQKDEEGEGWLLKAAEAGETWAMVVLGSHLIAGEGISQNEEEGGRWIRKAAEAGHAYAMAFLSDHLLSGRGMSQDVQEGEIWLRKAAEVGHAPAMVSLGDRLLNGEGILQNASEGERWLRKAAEVGDAHAMAVLGSRLLVGQGVTPNAEEGERWLRRGAAAGEAQAMRVLGLCLLDRQGMSPRIEEGEHWLRKAAEAGDIQAMRVLISDLIAGQGVSQNEEERGRWIRKVAEAGDAVAMYLLGIRLLEGQGGAPNAEEGERWIRKAAAAGDSSARSRLGVLIYERALELSERGEAHQEAGGLFHDAWKKDGLTAVNLAYMLRRREFSAEGLDVTRLLGELVKKEDPFALVNQALHLIRASPSPEAWREADALLARAVVSPDVGDVVGWWSKTAKLGDPEGQLVMALLWRHGCDLADTDSVAAMWEIAERDGWVIPAEHRGQITAPEVEE